MGQLELLVGDLFEAPADALGQGVNVDGLSDAGIAVPFARRFPRMQEAYVAACASGELSPGGFLPWQAPDGRWIYNIASQDRPVGTARLEWLESGLRAALEHAGRHGAAVLAVPRIGCGYGGLSWEQVHPVMRRCAADASTQLHVWSRASGIAGRRGSRSN